jgi:hypothetical protein
MSTLLRTVPPLHGADIPVHTMVGCLRVWRSVRLPVDADAVSKRGRHVLQEFQQGVRIKDRSVRRIADHLSGKSVERLRSRPRLRIIFA